jgi:threonine synthase
MDEQQRSGTDWILVATAHPAKFETIVEPLIDSTIPLPPELNAILSRPSHSVTIAASLDALMDSMRDRFFNI